MQNINPHTFIQNLTKEAYQKRMVLQITFTMRIKMVYFLEHSNICITTIQRIVSFFDKATDEEYDGKDVDSGKVYKVIEEYLICHL